jgi:hypothetical protein
LGAVGEAEAVAVAVAAAVAVAEAEAAVAVWRRAALCRCATSHKTADRRAVQTLT